MSLISDVIGGNKSSGYSELTDEDLESPPSKKTDIGFIDVKSQDDLVTSKEALNDGKIVFLDISYIESNGLSLDVVYSEMQGAVESVNGDIVHKKRNDIIVATPRDVSVLREKL